LVRSNTTFVRKEQKPEHFQGYPREVQDMNAQDTGYSLSTYLFQSFIFKITKGISTKFGTGRHAL
jgi:hypothetical protein